MTTLPFDVLFDPLAKSDLSPKVVSDNHAAELDALDDCVPVRLAATKFVNGELVFSDAIHASLCLEWRELKDGANGIKNRHEWRRLEIKAANTSTEISSNYSLVATRWPHENGWTYVTKFKPGWTDLADQKPKPGNDINTHAKLLYWLEAEPVDYWETRSGILTAGLSRPERFKFQDTPDAREKPLTLMGVCADFDACVAYLRTQSVRIAKLREDTLAGTLKFGPANFASSRTGISPKKRENSIADALAYLDLAIVQALAGGKDPLHGLGRPVDALVEEIYLGHLNNTNYREKACVGGNSSGLWVPFSSSAYNPLTHNNSVASDDDELDDQFDIMDFEPDD